MQRHGRNVPLIAGDLRQLAIDVIAHPDREHEMDDENDGELAAANTQIYHRRQIFLSISAKNRLTTTDDIC